jgi:hypothetical protein
VLILLAAAAVSASTGDVALTESRIKLIREVGLEGKDSSEVLRLAHLNSLFETGLRSPLAVTSLAVVIAAVAIPFTPLGPWFGFVPPPAWLLAVVAILTASYLMVVELVKRWFFQRHPLS